MSVDLNQSVAFAVGNEDSDGNPADAASFVATLYRNGAATAESVTETNLATGIYSIAFTVPSGWTAGDILQIRIVSDGIGRFVWGDEITRPVLLNPATQTQIDNIETIVEGLDGGGSSLSGPYTRTVTVTDLDTSAAIQNAKVRLYRTGETGTELTNVSGVATFTVEAATWSYAITANGYTGVTGTIAVSANGDTAIELDAATVTPPDDPALCAVIIHVRDQYGVDIAGQPVEITFVKWDTAATETPPVLSIPPVLTTDSGGLVQVNLYRLAVYKIIYGESRDARRWDGTIPDAGSYEVEM